MRNGIPIDAARPPDHQHRIGRIIDIKRGEDLSRQRDSVDDDAHCGGMNAPLAQPVGHRARLERKRLGDGPHAAAHRRSERGWLAHTEPPAQLRVVSVFIGQCERVVRLAPWRGGQERDSGAGPTERAHGVERLSERLGEMGFVQQDHSAGAEQPRVDGLHAIGHAVSAEQQPRAHLVDGGAHNGGLRRRARPIVLQRHPTPKALDDQRGPVVAGQSLQAPGHFGDDPASAASKRFGDLSSAGKRIVDDKPPVHDERDTQRRPGGRIGAQCQMEDGRVEGRRFP